MKALITLLLFGGTATGLAANSIHVFAAAGTAPAMKAIAHEYTKQTATPILFNLANSGVLAKQIAAGAKFDLFFSANEKWMDYAEHKGFIAPATRTTLLKNEMVVIVPAGASTNINLSAFTGRVAIGDQATPIGIYTQQAFTKTGCWNSIRRRACVGDTVNKVLNYVALGEADAGVVFRSVAFCASNRVTVARAVPPALHAPIRFPIAAAQGAPAAALDFLHFTQSPTAHAIFKTYGWSPAQ